MHQVLCHVIFVYKFVFSFIVFNNISFPARVVNIWNSLPNVVVIIKISQLNVCKSPGPDSFHSRVLYVGLSTLDLGIPGRVFSKDSASGRSAIYR